MSSNDIQTVLVVSNRRCDENAGRAEKLKTRSRLLTEQGWDMKIGYVEPSMTGLPIGTLKCIQLARDADVINSISNPPHLQVAGAIAARVTKTPWLAEFRDPLVANPDVPNDGFATRLRQLLERYILTHADRVIWYDGIQIPDNYFENTYPDVSSTICRKLPPIGYETKKFEDTEPTAWENFTISYAGSFYEGWIEPYTFIKGLAEYCNRETATSDITARFYGDWQEEYAAAAEEAEVAKYVSPQPFIPHEEVISHLKGSDILLYIGGDDPRNRRNLPSKIYDYIGAGQPILAIVDPTFRIAEVIRNHGFGIVVRPGDTEGVSDAIDRIRTGNFTYRATAKQRRQFSRAESNSAYVKELERIV
ncbi:hypothetical protein [Haloarcula nitratireducens]|uniref:Glycosyltransferase n=1 Tax=Haloarcula nitratireducens TaxID=2487749 RepID=A0AAW4P7Z4_9EURY|nr:hypothetical protein [Halomicroarcula nitratireducens]MBX0294014.1 hypothetical protein [Halomicroarcula nitratireducens]